jgi:hypothetical protein
MWLTLNVLLSVKNSCEVRDFDTHKLSLLILVRTEHTRFSTCFEGKRRTFYSRSMFLTDSEFRTPGRDGKYKNFRTGEMVLLEMHFALENTLTYITFLILFSLFCPCQRQHNTRIVLMGEMVLTVWETCLYMPHSCH